MPVRRHSSSGHDGAQFGDISSGSVKKHSMWGHIWRLFRNLSRSRMLPPGCWASCTKGSWSALITPSAIFFWAQCKVAVIWPIVDLKDCGYLRVHLLPYALAQVLRSFSGTILHLLPMSNKHLEGMQERTFPVAVLQLLKSSLSLHWSGLVGLLLMVSWQQTFVISLEFTCTLFPLLTYVLTCVLF